MTDPLVWAMTPGMGRAPLLAPPQQAASVTQNPRRDLAMALGQMTGNNRVLPGDRPVGALVRDPLTMTGEQMRGELVGLGGTAPGMGTTAATRAPAAVGGLLGGIPGLGTAMGYMAGQGVQQRRADLGRQLSHERLRARPGTQMAAALDPYEQGREAARVQLAQGGGQASDQRDISRDRDSRASPGWGRSDDPDVGWGGA